MLSHQKEVFVIAEIGVNHNGDRKIAVELINKAKEAGADAVKFQIFHTDNLVTQKTQTSSYQKRYAQEDSQYQMLKKLELKYEDFYFLYEICRKYNIEFLATPFDIESVDFLVSLSVPYIKISSADITNLYLLEYVCKKGVPVILSTGMADLEEIEKALKIFEPQKDRLILLHCVSSYPTPIEEINLNSIPFLKERFNVAVGLSDHTTSIYVPCAAVALGAVVIEKHFTLSHSLKGPDHHFALEPHQFKEMVKGIREIEKALGERLKKVNKLEQENRLLGRRSIVAKRDIKCGEKVDISMIDFKRPSIGIEASLYKKIIGKRAKCDIKKDTYIRWEMLE